MDAIVAHITALRHRIRLLRACNTMVEDHNTLYSVGDDVEAAIILSRLTQLLTMAKFQGYLTGAEVRLVCSQLCFDFPLEDNEEESTGRSN